MELERERGITIKARAVNLSYNNYALNLIDTPGHVDFTHEVSRSLAACEGALLIVDSSQGIQAQTVSNFYLARNQNLHIIPVINKIDLPAADSDRVMHQLENVFGIRKEDVITASAREGKGIQEILNAVISRIPSPGGSNDMPVKALIFDSVFDNYRGVLVFIRVMEGKITSDAKIRFMMTGKTFNITEIGVFKPGLSPVRELSAGMVGYLAGNIRNVSDVRVGDTVTVEKSPASSPLPGYRLAKAMVFSSFYPSEGTSFQDLQTAIDKLQLNDASFTYETENSPSLGFGFRCGFLGMLHLEIVRERLEREYDLNLITTAPSTLYRIRKQTGEIVEVDNPNRFPPWAEIAEILEFYVNAQIILPDEYLGSVIKLCKDRRGVYKETTYLDQSTVSLTFEMPVAEIMTDFFDRLKSVTSGYASIDYEYLDWRISDPVKLDILLNGELIACFSSIVHRSKSYQRARQLTSKLKETISPHLFAVNIQAAIGGKIIARETKSALRKDVTAKLYGGDITRKRKLLEKQKKGKTKMKKFGKIALSQEAFMAVLK
jgi:GTP-binding protein LepA